MSTTGLTLVLIARLPPDGVAAFQAYEDRVLPLLAEHGGSLQRRLRSADALTEVHLVWFPSEASFTAYRSDPRRTEHAALLQAARAGIEVLALDDVPDPAGAR